MKIGLASYRCENRDMTEAVRIIIKENPIVPLTAARTKGVLYEPEK